MEDVNPLDPRYNRPGIHRDGEARQEQCLTIVRDVDALITKAGKCTDEAARRAILLENYSDNDVAAACKVVGHRLKLDDVRLLQLLGKQTQSKPGLLAFGLRTKLALAHVLRDDPPLQFDRAYAFVEQFTHEGRSDAWIAAGIQQRSYDERLFEFVPPPNHPPQPAMSLHENVKQVFIENFIARGYVVLPEEDTLANGLRPDASFVDPDGQPVVGSIKAFMSREQCFHALGHWLALGYNYARPPRLMLAFSEWQVSNAELTAQLIADPRIDLYSVDTDVRSVVRIERVDQLLGQ